MLSEQFAKMGHYSQVLTGKSGFGRITSFFNLAMSLILCKASIWTFKKKIDYVIVEYPFREHNPIIVFFFILLYLSTRLNHTRLLLSMHEYDRVNVLRKRVLDVFMRVSDWVYVSEEKYLRKFDKLAYKMSIRSIPNHIVCKKENKVYNPKSFCYFGLVNKSKAFEAMLKSWEVFNQNGDNSLDIISSTDLSEWHLDKYCGIRYHYNLSNSEVVDVMFPCAFSIIPVIPDIGNNNSSFVSAIQCGCVPIGKFGEELKSMAFAINVNDYGIDTMVQAFNQAQQIEAADFFHRSEECVIFGRKFSIENTAIQMLETMNKIFK